MGPILEHLGIDEDAGGQVPVWGLPSRASPGSPESDSSAASSDNPFYVDYPH